MMRYLSVCSGIEAATVAWHPLGWEPVAFSEIDPFASAVLAHHYPNVPNLGDMERYNEWKIPAIDVLVGGTPCQSFSVAGLRRGLDDPRGNLALIYLGILDKYRPRWCIWENVPGVLSSNGGRDFGAFLGALADLGYGFAYRVLDAQYVRTQQHPYAVPQRRRRVFVVGHSGGDARRAAEVLLEPESVRGNPPTRRQAGQGAPADASTRARGGGVEVANALTARMRKGVDSTCHSQTLIPSFDWPVEVADPVTANEGKTYTHEGAFNFRLHNVVPAVGFQSNLGSQGGDVFVGVSPTMRIGSSGDNKAAVAFDAYNQTATGDVAQIICSRGDSPGGSAHLMPAVVQEPYTLEVRGRAHGRELEYRTDGTANCLRLPNGGRDGLGVGAVATTVVRRLTPRECERLQAFPDDYTAIIYRGKPAADGPRYKALGNSMACNVMHWIGARIAKAEGQR